MSLNATVAAYSRPSANSTCKLLLFFDKSVAVVATYQLLSFAAIDHTKPDETRSPVSPLKTLTKDSKIVEAALIDLDSSTSIACAAFSDDDVASTKAVYVGSSTTSRR